MLDNMNFDNVKDRNIRKLIDDLYSNENYKRLIEKYCRPLIYDDAFGICHSEAMHTNFIKWLVKQSSQKYPNKIMYNFIKAICDKGKEQLTNKSTVKADVDYVKKILSQGNLTISIKNNNDIQDKEGCSTYYKKNSKPKIAKVDLVIDLELKTETRSTPLKIIIENKVYSKEHDNQTDIYYAYFSGNNEYFKNNPKEDLRKFELYKKTFKAYLKKDERQFFVFLHPADYDMKAYASNLCPNFIKFTYQDLLDKVILASIDEFTPDEKVWIEDYIKIIIRPDKINRTMAKYSEDKKIIEQFVKDYATLFKLVIEDLQKTNNEDIKEVNKIIEEKTKNKSMLYDLEIKDSKYESLVMREVADKVVSYILNLKKIVYPVEYLNKKLNVLHINEPWILEKKHYLEKKSASTQDPAKFERRWDEIDGSIYIENQWKKELFVSFIDKVQSEFPEISIVVSQNQ